MEITFCINNTCPLINKCGRHQTNNDAGNFIMWSSYAYFENENESECNYFYSLDDEDESYLKNKNISC